MSGITIKTDRKWKFFAYRCDVPAAVLASQFDYQNEDDALGGFFKYQGYWYHLDGFMRLNDGSAIGDDLAGWQAYASDSAFSGVVIKISKDGEKYMVGTYYS